MNSVPAGHVWLWFALLLPAATSPIYLADGTMVRVRLLNPITSELSTSGQPIGLVVTRDVIVGGEVVIARGAQVSGMIVKARRADWEFLDDDKAQLAFTFHHTTTTNGQVIRLRASPTRRPNDRVVVNRSRYDHHDLQWATEGDTFYAYVDGNYER
jgi:hypothetical protein